MLNKLKPITPGQRGTVLVSKKHLSKESPYKPLTRPNKSTSSISSSPKVVKTVSNDFT